jgi:hypothetical protein
MDSLVRKNKIASYGAAYKILSTAIRRFSRSMWQFRASPDSWTIHEIIVHIADSEVNSYIRCRRFLAEPGGPVLGYDEMRWARELEYQKQSPEDALELFRLLRMLSHRLILSQPEEVWTNTVHHSENGQMTMEDWLDTYERHIPEHVKQMEMVFDIWKSTQS